MHDEIICRHNEIIWLLAEPACNNTKTICTVTGRMHVHRRDDLKRGLSSLQRSRNYVRQYQRDVTYTSNAASTQSR